MSSHTSTPTAPRTASADLRITTYHTFYIPEQWEHETFAAAKAWMDAHLNCALSVYNKATGEHWIFDKEATLTGYYPPFGQSATGTR